MTSMAPLIKLAIPMAINTSISSNLNNLFNCWDFFTTTLPCVNAECRNMACGITVAPRMPVASKTLSGPLMLMVGNETMGLNKAFKEYCDKLCTIPMAETSYASSFNVSCAASIMMYEIVRQRNS